MSKNLCKECKYFNPINNICIVKGGFVSTKGIGCPINYIKQPTIFQQITRSHETLAEKLIYEIRSTDPVLGGTYYWWCSTIPFIFGEDGYAVAEMCGKQHYAFKTISRIDDYIEPEKVLANAHLIAAAPEMYECICDALTDLEMPDGMRRHFEAVLRKARGEE